MPNTALPPAIQRQLDEAAAIERQVYGDPAPAQPTEVVSANTEAAPVPAVETPPVDEAPAAQVPEVPATVVDTEEEKFARRYEVLQAKYNAEVPRLHAQLREAANNIAYLTGEVARLSQAQTSAPAPAAAPTEPDDDAERFGADLISTVDRRTDNRVQAAVREATAPLVDIINRLENQLQQVGQRVEVTDQDRFETALAKAVPDWEQTNSDPAFLQWLAQADPIYGVPRQAALDQAARNLDVDRVARIFQTYNSLTRNHVGEQERSQSRKQLERQVAPPTTTASSTPTPAGKIWTLADYEAAHDHRNVQRVGPEEAARLIEEANKAYAEGRIRW